MTDLSIESTAAASTEDHRWLAGDASAFDTALSGTIQVSSLTSGTHYDATTKVVSSGLLLSKVGDFLVPYDGANEVQTVTIGGGATAGTLTLTFGGETTAAITFGATAAQVQTALEALSNVEPGDIIVSGASPAYTLTFGGQYTGENVPQLTSTSSLTGGTPTITHATTTAGGSATGAAVVDGILLHSVPLIRDNGSVSTVIVVDYTKDATIIPAKLPVAAQRSISRFTPTTCKLALVA